MINHSYKITPTKCNKLEFRPQQKKIQNMLCLVFAYKQWHLNLNNMTLFGLLSCLDFGACPLFLFLSFSLGAFIYKAWQGFII